MTSVLFLIAAVAVLSSSSGVRAEWGLVLGRLFWVVLLLPGLIVGTITHVSSRRWGRGRYVLVVLAAEFFSLLLSGATAVTDSAMGV